MGLVAEFGNSFLFLGSFCNGILGLDSLKLVNNLVCRPMSYDRNTGLAVVTLVYTTVNITRQYVIQ